MLLTWRMSVNIVCVGGFFRNPEKVLVRLIKLSTRLPLGDVWAGFHVSCRCSSSSQVLMYLKLIGTSATMFIYPGTNRINSNTKWLIYTCS